jgi:hypothetical protein
MIYFLSWSELILLKTINAKRMLLDIALPELAPIPVIELSELAPMVILPILFF